MDKLALDEIEQLDKMVNKLTEERDQLWEALCTAIDEAGSATGPNQAMLKHCAKVRDMLAPKDR